MAMEPEDICCNFKLVTINIEIWNNIDTKWVNVIQ